MKIRNIITACLMVWFTQNLPAQYNLSPDAPINPMPVKFHKSHFFLKGNVKKQIKYIDGKISDEHLFNEKGYLRARYEHSLIDTPYDDGLQTLSYNYYYNEDNLLTEVKCSSYFNDLKIVPDNNGRPVKTIDFDGIIRRFEYDNNGNLVKEYTENKSSEMNYYFDYEYQYDNENRLIKKKVFKSDGSLNKTVTYSYQQDGEFLKIIENKGKETLVWYYKNGHNCGTKPTNVKFDENGNPLFIDKKPYKYIYY